MDDVTIRWVFGGIIAAGLAMNGWLWRRITKMEDTHAKHATHVQQHYKPKEDIHRELGKIEGRLDTVQTEVKDSMQRFEDKLDKAGEKMDQHLGRIYDQINAKADKSGQ